MKNQCKRIKDIIEMSGKSDRAFAKVLGIPPTSLASALAKNQEISPLWAYAIQVKFGYSAEWILEGKGEEKAASGTNEQALNQMLADSLRGLFPGSKAVPFIEQGLLRIIDEEALKKQRAAFKAVEKDASRTRAKANETLLESTAKQMKLVEQRTKLFQEAYDDLDNDELLSLYFQIYIECVLGQEKESEFYLIGIAKKTYTTRVLPLASQIIATIEKHKSLWELD